MPEGSTRKVPRKAERGEALPATASAPTPAMPIFRVFVPFACGYYLSYLYRTINAVISPDLVRDLALDAGQLGLLTSTYFLAFGLFQLPLGILLDRFGPRRVDAALLAVAGLGALVFALSRDFAGLVLARALIGFGVSAALMASIKAFTLWFALSRLASLNGWVMAIGGLGALSASVPVEAALRFTDWRGVFEVLAALTLLAAGAILYLVPERAAPAGGERLGAMLRGVAGIFGDAGFWRIAVICMAVQATFLSVAGLWVGPWLYDVAALPRGTVATYLLVFAVAMTAGFAFFGTAADRLESAGWGAERLFVLGAAVSTAGLALVALGVTRAALAIWIVVYFSSPAGALSYAILSRRYPSAQGGRVNTALNFLVFAAAFAAQWGIGAIVNLWPAADGVYPLAAFRAAFGACVALEVAALAWWLAPRRAATRRRGD
ncbi:MAG: MFS transporter [Burkholderiales bacterium]|nr:MFS transporter [Burkholderiales bacterium]